MVAEHSYSAGCSCESCTLFRACRAEYMREYRKRTGRTTGKVPMKYLPKDDPDYPHGHRTGYAYGCRCEPCRDANSIYGADLRRRQGRVSASVAVKRPGKGWEHGTRYGYVYGRCRCDECRRANREYQRSYMRLQRAGITWNDPWIDEALR
jgi:hypothetical protein